MYKKLLFALFALFAAMSFTSCETEDEEETTSSEWKALCKENSWLYEFPEFTGKYSNATATEAGDSWIIVLADIENGESEFEKYSKKLVSDGFVKKASYTYVKTINGRDYTVSSSKGVISITFSKVVMP